MCKLISEEPPVKMEVKGKCTVGNALLVDLIIFLRSVGNVVIL